MRANINNSNIQALRLFVAFFLLLSVVFAPRANGTSLHSALDKYNFGEFKAAIEQWEHLARMGNPDALFNLGQVYRLGKGVDVDMAKVEYFFRRAAESGHLEAQNNLANLYYFDGESSSKRGEALTWWRTAARRGNATSQYMLAILHYNGEFVPKDNIQAFAWVVLAKQAGLTEASMAYEMMQRNLSDNEMNQGRLLSRGLVENTIKAPSFHLTIPNPLEGNMALNLNTPPLVVDSPSSPQVPPTPPTVSQASAINAPTTPSTPIAPPVANEIRQEEPSENIDKIDGWALQLGSFKNTQSPRQLFAQIKREQPRLVEGLTSQIAEADLGERGVFYRLIVGPFADKVMAFKRCEDLQSVGYNCFLVGP